MITYSDSEKYTSLFSKASEVLQFENTPTTISSLQDYYDVLKILAQKDPIFLRVPVDEDIFDINLNKRKITIPSSFLENGVGVKGDELAEAVYFKADRYFDSQDLADTDIFIEWQVGETKGISKAFCIDIETEPEKIIFGWAITSLMTEGNSNNLIFAPRFIIQKTNLDGKQEIIYSLGTQPQTVKINDTLNILKDENVVIDNTDTSSIIDSIIGGDSILNFSWRWNILEHEAHFMPDEVYVISVEAVTPSHQVTYQWYKRDLETKTESRINGYWDYVAVYDFNNPIYIPVEENATFDSQETYFTRDSETGQYFLAEISAFSPGVQYYYSTVGPIDLVDPNTPSGKTGLINDFLYNVYEKNSIFSKKKKDTDEYEEITELNDLFNGAEKGYFVTIDDENFINDIKTNWDGKIYRTKFGCTITEPGQYYATATTSIGNYSKTIQSNSFKVLKPVSVKDQIQDLSEFNGFIGTPTEEDIYYYYDEKEKKMFEYDKTKIPSSITLKAGDNIVSPDQGLITYQWEKLNNEKWEEILNATQNTYTVSTPGYYRVKVKNSLNGAHQEDISDSYAEITGLPEMPTILKTTIGSVTNPEVASLDGEDIEATLDNTKKELNISVQESISDGRYFSWYRYQPYDRDEALWPGEDDLPVIQDGSQLNNQYIVTVAATYYCKVYNYLNGLISSPTQSNNFIIKKQ